MSSNATPSQWERNGQVDENQEQNITNEKSESQSVRSVNDENPEVLNTQIPVPAEEISTEEICSASNLTNEVNNLDIQRLTLDDQNLDHSPNQLTNEPSTVSKPVQLQQRPTFQRTPCDNYVLKEIEWRTPSGLFDKVQIVTQNENGPCPLIGLCNALILRGDIQIRSQAGNVSYHHLIELLGDLLLNNSNLFKGSHSNSNTSPLEDVYHNLNDVMNVIPLLQTGLDVNVNHGSISSFELTPALLLFDAFSVKLFHGWTVDPQDKETYGIVARRCGTYNIVTEKIIAGQDASSRLQSEPNLDPLEKAKLEELSHEGFVCSEFLNTTASQLTYHGLFSLSTIVPKNAPSVFFRNNHFHVLLRAEKGDLVTLVTDQGFAQISDVVWETLPDVEGSSIFLDGHFTPYDPNSNTKSISDIHSNKNMGQTILDSDHELALRLQEQENNQRIHLPSTPVATSKQSYRQRPSSSHVNNSSVPRQQRSSKSPKTSRKSDQNSCIIA